MTLDAQVQTVVAKGFTERQSRFLALVMRHAGVCVMRQYATFSDIVFGDKTRAFFARLLRLGYASSFDISKGRGRLFHIHGRELYEAIGEPHSQFRRPPAVAHAIGRCMLPDVVLGERRGEGAPHHTDRHSARRPAPRLTLRLPFTVPRIRAAGTRRSRARPAMLIPNGTRRSCRRISPGWPGGSRRCFVMASVSLT
jgi:hypothetical protein